MREIWNRELWRVLFSQRMLIALAMGFACGLPLQLTGSLLQAWMKLSGVDLSMIGLFALVGLPYTLKFLWAPLFDRYTPSFLGRRRGWLLIAQLALIIAILALSRIDVESSTWRLAGAAFLVTLFAASQDIVVDAYRRESLADEELGLGASLYVYGYRVGLLVAGGGGLILATYIGFPNLYRLMAVLMLLGVITTLWAPEPPVSEGQPQSLREAVIEPFVEYFQRHQAWLMLGFVLLYKIGDTMAAQMTTPFYLDLGFSTEQIGVVVKLFGFWATVLGGLLGGVLVLRWGILRSLWVFGIFQGVSTLGFALLALMGKDITALATVIAFENLTGGMGTAAFVAYMGSLTNKRFTATQYALLSSFMGIPRVVIAAPTGYLAGMLGWAGFFFGCALIAIPGMLLLLRLQGEERPVPISSEAAYERVE